MKNHLPLLMLFLTIRILSFGQTFTRNQANSHTESSNKVRVDPQNGNIEYFEFSSTELKSASTNEATLKQKTGLPENYEFRPLKTYKDQQKNLHKKYQLFYKGIQIEGLTYTIHYKDGIPQSANGKIIKSAGAPTQPSINQTEAIEKAIAAVPAKQYCWDTDTSHYPDAELLYIQNDSSIILCYKVDIYALSPLSREYIYVDAIKGTIIQRLSRIHETNITGTASTKYSGIIDITTTKIDSIPNLYSLRETTRGNGIYTYSLNNDLSILSATELTDDDNVWDSIHHQTAYDAHYACEMTYDYFKSTFDRNSIDDNGFALVSYVHYGVNEGRAFWDGSKLKFGDGNETYLPLTSMQIVAHEITHGLTEKTANLQYRDEPGALNESFSDIFGICVENYVSPTTTDYILGEEVRRDGTAIRNMENPNSTGDPDTYLGKYWISESGDNGGIHTNSGVQNYWFYLWHLKYIGLIPGTTLYFFC